MIAAFPNMRCSARPGIGGLSGRAVPAASASANSRLRTGFGELRFSGPRTCSRSSTEMISSTASAMWIHEHHCVPGVTGAPSPRSNARVISRNAPPSGASTAPGRSRTTRVPSASAWSARASSSSASRLSGPMSGAERSVSDSSSRRNPYGPSEEVLTNTCGRTDARAIALISDWIAVRLDPRTSRL
jgi:hypothetical protein